LGEIETVVFRRAERNGFRQRTALRTFAPSRQVEARVTAPLLFDGLREFVEFAPASAGIGDGGEELQIAAVGSLPTVLAGRQAVDGFLHRGSFGFLRAVTVFYLAVVLEKGQIVDCGLDPENEAELIVEFDRNRPHGMFDPRPFNADVEAITHSPSNCGLSLRPRNVAMLSGLTV
jgi:hypothetical protein